MTVRRRWPPGRPRVLVTDCWLANAGDAAIALAVEHMVRDVVPDAAVVHAAYHHDTIGPLIAGLTLAPPLEDILGTRWAPPAPGWEEAGRAFVAGADLVISQGGGFLVEAYEPNSRIAALAGASAIGPPVVVLGQTVDRFTGAVRRRDLQALFSASPLVVVRDAPSADHAADLGAERVVLGTDLALALFPDPPRPAHRRSSADNPARPSDRRGTGVVLTSHHAEPERRPAVAEAGVGILRGVLERDVDGPVDLWSTVQGAPVEAGEDDRDAALAALAALGPRSGVTVARGYIPPWDAIERVRAARRLVTMRLHPALFAAATGTPFALVLSGQRRTVLDGTALADLAADPGDPAAIARVIDRCWGMEPAGVELWDALEPLRRRLDEVRSLLAAVLRDVGGEAADCIATG